MSQSGFNYLILEQSPCGGNIQQRYFNILNCIDKIARLANTDENKLKKYVNYKILLKARLKEWQQNQQNYNPYIQIPTQLYQFKDKMYYIDQKYDCDVEHLISKGAFNLEALPKLMYGLCLALNSLHSKGITHGSIDTFSIGYYSKRNGIVQQFVFMDFNLFDKGRTNLRNQESKQQDYHDLGKVFLKIIFGTLQTKNPCHKNQLEELKHSKEFSKYYECLGVMVNDKQINNEQLINQLNDLYNRMPDKTKLIINEEKLQQKGLIQEKAGTFNIPSSSKPKININSYRHTNPINYYQQMNSQMNPQNMVINQVQQITPIKNIQNANNIPIIQLKQNNGNLLQLQNQQQLMIQPDMQRERLLPQQPQQLQKIQQIQQPLQQIQQPQLKQVQSNSVPSQPLKVQINAKVQVLPQPQQQFLQQAFGISNQGSMAFKKQGS